MSDRGVSSDDGKPAVDAQHGRLGQARRVAAKELKEYLICSAYIWVLLTMFVLHTEIALRVHGGESKALPFAPHGFALVNALVLGKVALVVEELRLGQRIKPRPLIYPIVIEALILAVLFVAMHALEEIIGGLVHGRALAASVPAVGGGGLEGVAFAAASFFVAMLPFCAFRQVTRAIGWDRVRAILFGL